MIDDRLRSRPAASQHSATPQARNIYLALTVEHRAELDSIWRADHRVPSVESRRAWAEARNIDPGRVHSWFSKKRSNAIKDGLTVSEGSYELPARGP
ncbi:uncharacterized protein LAESUDRAFT_655183, partial [Laetiporus sulphureus 93-53]